MKRARGRTAIGKVLEPIEQAWSADNHPLVAELLERNPIVAWYGFSPDRFQEIIGALLREDVPVGGFVRTLGRLFSGASAEDLTEAESGDMTLGGEVIPSHFACAAQLFALRLQGRTREALRLSSRMAEEYGKLQPFFTEHPGWSLFSTVQHGVTAMLAGEFGDALNSFTQVRMHSEVSGLEFLVRDAIVKSALIEALYGDTERARALLVESEALPRTESWAERLIDANRETAVALIQTDTPEEAVRILATIPLTDVGEMWPFYAAAMHRSYQATGELRESQFWLENFEKLPLPRVPGVGYTGSILPILGAMGAIARGDLIEARARIESAEDSLPITIIATAVLALAAGNPRRALVLGHELRAPTRQFRRMETWRLAILTEAHFVLGSEEECRQLLEFALEMPDDLRAYEARCFSPHVRRFAEECVTDGRLERWPVERAAWADDPGALRIAEESLTERELELLRVLATGQSREQIAKSEFISMNTLKAHLRSVYRKLGVRSRNAAVLEAERRGLV